MMKEATKANSVKRKLTGEVISKSGNKSIVVKVSRSLRHAMYNKFITKSKKYHVHDEENKAVVGNKVVIIEARPTSKLKKWNLETIK